VHLDRCTEILDALPAAGPQVAELRQAINDMADAYDVRLAELTSTISAVVIPSLEVTISMLGERCSGGTGSRPQFGS
jgi:hypothetical protein